MMHRVVIHLPDALFKKIHLKATASALGVSTIIRQTLMEKFIEGVRLPEEKIKPAEKAPAVRKAPKPFNPDTFDPAASDAAVDAYINSPESKAEAARWNSIPPERDDSQDDNGWGPGIPVTFAQYCKDGGMINNEAAWKEAGYPKGPNR
jgi:hypothetical protein